MYQNDWSGLQVDYTGTAPIILIHAVYNVKALSLFLKF